MRGNVEGDARGRVPLWHSQACDTPGELSHPIALSPHSPCPQPAWVTGRGDL